MKNFKCIHGRKYEINFDNTIRIRQDGEEGSAYIQANRKGICNVICNLCLLELCIRSHLAGIPADMETPFYDDKESVLK
jgi:hypothetical protein